MWRTWWNPCGGAAVLGASDERGAVRRGDLDLGARRLHLIGPHEAVPPADLGKAERVVVPASGSGRGDGAVECCGRRHRVTPECIARQVRGLAKLGWGSSMLAPSRGDIAIYGGVHFGPRTGATIP